MFSKWATNHGTRGRKKGEEPHPQVVRGAAALLHQPLVKVLHGIQGSKFGVLQAVAHKHLCQCIFTVSVSVLRFKCKRKCERGRNYAYKLKGSSVRKRQCKHNRQPIIHSQGDGIIF
jgi:hypothetical protein